MDPSCTLPFPFTLPRPADGSVQPAPSRWLSGKGGGGVTPTIPGSRPWPSPLCPCRPCCFSLGSDVGGRRRDPSPCRAYVLRPRRRYASQGLQHPSATERVLQRREGVVGGGCEAPKRASWPPSHPTRIRVGGAGRGVGRSPNDRRVRIGVGRSIQHDAWGGGAERAP